MNTARHRAADQELIDVVYSWYRMRSRYPKMADDGLVEAVRKHNDFGLDDTHTPAVGDNTTDTSRAAAKSMDEHVGGQAREVYDEILAVYNGGGIGLTSDQVEQLLNRSHQSISARINGLRDKGWVKDSGVKRKTRSGRQAIVWTPTLRALARGGN